MAIDMPPAPAVQYRIERPAAAVPDRGVAQISLAMAQARKSIAARSAEGSKDPTSAQMFPAIDPASRALTSVDRQALASRIGGDPARSTADAPNSYVGDRIRLAALRVKTMEASVQGRLVAEEAHAVRCRTIAVAMDRRAGAYVVGGEQAAQNARRSISRESLEDCRSAVMAQNQPGRAVGQSSVGVDPRQAQREQQRVQPVSFQPKPVQVDPKARQTKPVHIDPRAMQATRVNIDL